ncbi:MAG: carboxylate-amine ligase [Deltaproteobacteria bacterium]|nr:carboxylate-amine ligase [Deltaproteobacteria bacterium]
MDNPFTLGVEEEFQIVHPGTRELRSYVSKILDEGEKTVLRERVRAEMHQSMVETGTGICRDIHDVRKELIELRSGLDSLARKGGLRIIAASTHPISDWKTQEITQHARYDKIVEDLQDVARANLIFGLHVHVGFTDKNVAMEMANQVRYFLPHVLAITTSSPFWLGRNTGLKSVRCEVFKRFPRTGVPGTFSSYAEFEEYVNLLIHTGCIDNAKKIWWDVRVHPFFDTVEVRIADMPTNIEHTISVVALIQAIFAQLYLLYKRNMAWRAYPSVLIEENKWRAVRYGMQGKLIDFGKKCEVPVSDLILELLDFVDEAAGMLGTRKDLEGIKRILEEGTSADRQLEVYRKSGGDTKAVVDWLIEETMRGLPKSDSTPPPGIIST